MNKLLKIGIWVLFVASTFVVLGFAKSRHSKIPCETPKIIIHHDTGFDFLSSEMVLEQLRDIGYNFQSNQLCEVDLRSIEEKIVKVPGVAKVESYVFLNGELVIDITQRRPIVRIINASGTSFYIDDSGNSMPLSMYCFAKVPVITGDFEEPVNCNVQQFDRHRKKESLLDEIYAVASCIDRNEFWQNQLVQLYINRNHELEMIPRVGDQRILFGEMKNINDKFNKLEIFYKKGIKAERLNLYDTLSIKYKDQIVCSKK